VISRRTLLRITTFLGPFALLSGVTGTAGASQKVSKKTVQYQDHPHGDQHCSKCRFFIKPHSCQLVEGNIKTDGWCTLFQAKS
jgi:hypothetical protein